MADNPVHYNVRRSVKDSTLRSAHESRWRTSADGRASRCALFADLGVCGRGRFNVRDHYSAAGDEFATAQAQSVHIGIDKVGKLADAVLP